MRKDVQEIFKATPHEKQVRMFSATLSTSTTPQSPAASSSLLLQWASHFPPPPYSLPPFALESPPCYFSQVMMFSATLSTEMRSVCKKFMQDPMEIYVDDSKLTLHGLQQHYVKLAENEKNRKLNELLDALEFNQVGRAPHHF